MQNVNSSVVLFSFGIRLIWVSLIALACAVELMPMKQMLPYLFIAYNVLKVTLFFTLGFALPLAFHRLKGIAAGLCVSLVSAVAIESLQSVIHNGHSFHVPELLGKVALICLGFALSLDHRYEGRIPLGVTHISLRAREL
jgi:glycopeptide antibiotics resistance protein